MILLSPKAGGDEPQQYTFRHKTGTTYYINGEKNPDKCMSGDVVTWDGGASKTVTYQEGGDPVKDVTATSPYTIERVTPVDPAHAMLVYIH